MPRDGMTRRWVRAVLGTFAFVPAAALALSPVVAQAAPNVLRVGSYYGIPGTFSTIQAAVNAAHPGDWILIGPGDYHEQADRTQPGNPPAGVYITTPNIHLRGMDRNGVIVDGTLASAATPCSNNKNDQDLGYNGHGRNGLEVRGPFNAADNVSIENLTACNFITSLGGSNGNQIWWNGGDGGGNVGLSGYLGTYLTATSTYSSKTSGALGDCCGVSTPAGSYGIFSSDATHGLWQNDYASNMADSAYYVGACQQICDMTMDQDHGQFSALCLSSTNAGGYFLVQHTECDQNKTGLVNNSQNNDDWPSPQHGACSGITGEPTTGILGTASCTVWQYNYLHDNNNPNVPGNGIGGLAGGGPVGTGLILAGSRDITLYKNTISNNNSWGELIVDLPDQETAPADAPNCNGGIWVAPVSVCFYEAAGNLSLDNIFSNNGNGFGGPPNGSLGDIGLATAPHPSPPFEDARGNCFSGDTDAGKPLGQPTTDPPGIEQLPAYQPSGGVCSQSNTGDYGPLLVQAGCASQLLFPCPTPASLCVYNPQLPCTPVSTPVDYNRPDPNGFTLTMPAPNLTPTMPDPCGRDAYGQAPPPNPWCPGGPGSALPDVRFAALPGVVGGIIVAVWLFGSGRLRRRRTA